MTRYSMDIIKALKTKGYNTNRIRKEKIFTESQLQQFRDNKLVTQDVLNKLCKLLNCQVGAILEYAPDDDAE